MHVIHSDYLSRETILILDKCTQNAVKLLFRKQKYTFFFNLKV